jgi:hypothetical protein
VHFGSRDGRRRAAVEIALQKANRALARRIVAERDVHVRIDEARDRGGAVRIDDDVTAVHLGGRSGTDGYEFALLRNDRVTGQERLSPVAGNNSADIGDGDAHRRGVFCLAGGPHAAVACGLRRKRHDPIH